jgi:glucose-6-phosphate dehydrogenase assembly protein OpcA
MARDLMAGPRSSAAARVLNMVAVVDRDRSQEVEERLAQVGRYHPSFTIICGVGSGEPSAPDANPERVTIDVAPEHLVHLDAIVDPLLVSGLSTVVWAPHGHPEAVDSLLRLADVVLLDSTEEPDIGKSLARVGELAERVYVVDLAWLRSTPWRERVAFTFDPAEWRPELRHISAVTVRHGADSAVAALLLVGWLASRLEWTPEALAAEADGRLTGEAHANGSDVQVRLEPAAALDVPGLAGLTLETSEGMSISLERAPGGLAARRTTPEGRESAWTVLGASRGESGILGEGVRQALLRDPTYRPAVAAARAMLA